ncbi:MULTISPECIES: hypothetical protein [Nostoc]|uniref:FHA domain-containing protein n=1 Tax=Nostoc paludosum FACHB-159 TaxID=2692908 RepID=A0ABR8KEA2_9NOSO|nr:MULTISPECIES: hypothetical protein [Nostoc]MBD2680161.1 hypothetical protein [Nostoc sp. FACHB-857]MBD2736432.1 hypothetical protein [Nostoc paludosum FACHB-159]
MMNLTIRAILYAICGVISALLGWSISQILWLDIGGNFVQFLPKNINIPPYLILFMVITPFITSGMIIAEVFLSNPTRYQANWRVISRTSLKRVFIIGAFLGLQLTGLNWLLLASNWPGVLVRIISWMEIGAFAGLAESVSWSWRSIDGKGSQVTQRIVRSTLCGAGAGLLAAILSEGVNQALGQYRDVFGFLLFGALLGWALCFAAIPSYRVALRAGHGFEAVKPKTRRPTTVIGTQANLTTTPTQILNPTLNNSSLKFIPDGNYRNIEEGLSIQLPTYTKTPLIIGSGNNVDIYIPHLSQECVALEVNFGTVEISCLAEGFVQIQNGFLSASKKETLRHNQIITLYHEDNQDKFYRFVFYDRLLDPQA